MSARGTFVPSLVKICSWGTSGQIGKMSLSCDFFIYYRQDTAKRQKSKNQGQKRPKIRFFAPQGRLVVPIQVKLGRANGHLGPLGCAKFHLNRLRGCECGAQNQNFQKIKYKKFHLLEKSRLAGANPWPISKAFRAFIPLNYTPNNPASVFQISHDSLHRLRSYCWETARRSIRPNFSVHPVGKTMRWTEKWMPPFWWPRQGLSPCKVWGRSYSARRLYRCENMVFVCYFLSPLRPARCSFDGDIIWTDVVSRFMGRFWRCLHRFQHWLPFQMHLVVLIPVARWRHKFRQIAFKNLEKSKKIGGKVCAGRLRIDNWEI